MLDLVRRKLTTENHVLEASKAFIDATKNGELLVMEFMPHLAGFCEKIVDWYDEPRLSALDRGHLRALFKVIKSIKKTTEAGKSAIIRQSVQVPNPSEFYQHAYDNIVEDYTKFEENIRKELRRRVHSNVQPAGVRTRELLEGEVKKKRSEAHRTSKSKLHLLSPSPSPTPPRAMTLLVHLGEPYKGSRLPNKRRTSQKSRTSPCMALC